MKNLHKKAVAAVLVMSSMTAFSTTVNAEEASVEKVFACGDAKNGATLVVTAIASGRETADKVHAYLS